MAANNEKTSPVTFGATIEGSDLTAPTLRSPPSHESNMSVTDKDSGIDSSNPYSAFYNHPEARRSMDAASAPQSKTHLDVAVYERDLEAGPPLSAATTQAPRVSVDGRVKECSMWPSRQTLMEQKRKNKMAKSCGFMRNMTGKQRLWTKIAIALFIIAAAVGLGVGISKAVGGGVWKSDGHSKDIA